MSLLPSFSSLRAHLRPSNVSSARLITVRHASLNSAIGRGIRKSRGADDSFSPRNSFNDDYPRRGQKDTRPRDRTDDAPDKYQQRKRPDMKYRSAEKKDEFDPDEFIRTGNFRASSREFQQKSSDRRKEYPDAGDKFQQRSPDRRRESTDAGDKFQPRSYDRRREYPGSGDNFQQRGPDRRRENIDFGDESKPRNFRKENTRAAHKVQQKKSRKDRAESKHRSTEKMPERVKDHVNAPESIPYTTPASEFIYGTNAVEAALRCSRRKVYKLYIYQAAGEELSPAKIGLRKLALMKNIAVKLAFAEWDRLFDKMSAGRPHNGCILEVSPLPKLPVQSLRAVSSPDEDTFRVDLGVQSREEAAINGTNNQIAIHQPNQQQRRRYPVTLLLDGIVDTGNLGAIIRSAYYLGIDAIIFAGRNSAPLSPVTIKSSAGAAENMPLLGVSNEQTFIQQSKENGWRFYAADAPGPGSTLLEHLSESDASGGDSRSHLTQAPSVLMMGSESSGLSRHIKSLADSIVSIPGARFSDHLGVQSDPARVDSLNVSVAAALLMDMFLRVPLQVTEMPKKELSVR